MSCSIRIAIAIATLGRDEVLLDTLRDVFCQEPPADEILVIDQTELHTAEVQLLLDAWQREGIIRYVRQRLPSLPTARNRALEETNCDVVIFIDDDVRLARGFVEAHRKVYLEQPAVVAVAGRVKQTVPWPVVKRPTQWPRFMDYRFFRFDSEQRVDGFANFCGANHSVLTKYVRSLGGYDEGYKGVALREETDLALRIYAAGGLIVFEPLAWLLHLVAPSGGCRKKGAVDISGAMSIVRFSWKFRHVLGGFIFGELWHALRLGVLNRQVLSRPYLIPAVILKSILGFPKAVAAVQRKLR